MKDIDRREFLKLAGLAGGGAVLAACGRRPGYGVYEKTQYSGNELKVEDLPIPDYEQTKQLLFKLDRAGDLIEPYMPETPKTKEEAWAFAVEVAPFFIYEEIAEDSIREQGVVYPNREVIPDVQIRHFGGNEVFHLAGQARCYEADNPEIYMNLRYYNEYSPWSEKISQISVLIHETAHMNGICSDFSKGDEYNKNVETATQLATVEVLAGMTRDNNKWAPPVFIREVQDFAEDYFLAKYLAEDDIEGYKKEILEKTANHAYREAKFDKSMEHWDKNYVNQGRLRQIIRDYGLKPFLYMTEALNNEDYETRRLPFPNKKGTIKMNDTAYCLKNLDKLVEDYPKIL
jgi:hypothetical protein